VVAEGFSRPVDQHSTDEGAALPERSVSIANDWASAMEQCVLSELSVFTSWLEENDVEGVVSEFGWPNGSTESGWNAIAAEWLDAADQADLGLLAWAVGPFDSTRREAVYTRSEVWPEGAVDTPERPSSLLEKYMMGTGLLRGIAVTGGSWGDWKPSYSNTDPGVYGVDWFYETQATFDFLANRGFENVRIDFKWERIQPEPGGPLDDAELDRLRDVVERAGNAGLKVVLDLHNYGEYYSEGHVRNTIGSESLPVEAFVEIWRRLSLVFADDPTVVAYSLMNEPHDLGGSRLWEDATQAAVDGIRALDDQKLILVPGYGWSQVQEWSFHHPTAWIEDSASNFLYEAHHYWDRDHSGRYTLGFDEEIAALEQQGCDSESPLLDYISGPSTQTGFAIS
jgi:Cellulase (glycosyl hydrolase family 5)